MQTWEAIRSRRNVRSFEDRPIADDHLDEILESGRRSPSSQNWQPWDFIVVRQREQLLQLAHVWRGAGHVAHAAAAIALIAPLPKDERQRNRVQYDLGQATMSIMLAAVLGLGTGQVYYPRFVFREDRVLLSAMGQILQGRLGAHRQGPVNAFINQPARGVHQGGNLRERAAGLVMAQHPCPLHLPLGCRARMSQLGELFHLFRSQHEFGTLRRFRHGPQPTASRRSLSTICSCFNETIY